MLIAIQLVILCLVSLWWVIFVYSHSTKQQDNIADPVIPKLDCSYPVGTVLWWEIPGTDVEKLVREYTERHPSFIDEIRSLKAQSQKMNHTRSNGYQEVIIVTPKYKVMMTFDQLESLIKP
ncbi:MAG TPA: hypothetical protein VMU29_14920 [Smithella sp.]|nr:hypothetical protein [Smithella sp.]